MKVNAVTARASSSNRSTTLGKSASLLTADTLPARCSTERPARPSICDVEDAALPQPRLAGVQLEREIAGDVVPGVVLVGDFREEWTVEPAADHALKGVGGVETDGEPLRGQLVAHTTPVAR